ncbi:hypothetical protein IU443_29020 [Nocardia farcinica]|nr:hypothetical protein DXT66_08060 [Nocardia farcinica]MBF6234984.1 hypothetical protein [Nocardia farcinica]MBF6265912.1 hypothetical protein [Nocardia farcinica]MBF6271481.1 hypothetical protein [Nocardia farcinica]MBF6284437.1 hypothetical protein [Nocardia farcinica]
MRSSMSSARPVRTAAVAGSALTALLVATAPAAHAGPGGAFAPLYSLTQGPCVAMVASSVNGNAYPNQAAFTVNTTMLGVGSCELTVTLHWRNVQTGQTGEFAVTAHGPGYWSNSGPGAIFGPGVGSFTGWVSVNAPSVGASGEIQFDVPQYQG